MMPIRVLLVDDHQIVRAGIGALLRSLPDIEIVAEAGDGLEAISLIEVYQPHVVLTDISMPGFSGLELVERTSAQFPGVRFIILSMHTGGEFVSKALRVGAAGYVIKDASPIELELAIKAVASGQSYLSPAATSHVISDLARQPETSSQPHDVLTPRQHEILQLIAQGYTTNAIAQALNISAKTVATHRTQLMERLNINDIATLVRYAIRIGLVSPNDLR
jgi:DNA-binding NarL/FixJ family response regulator